VRLAFTGAITAALAIARPALADDRSAVLDAPAPPTLPSLAHPTLTYTFEFTGASITPSGSRGPPAYAWFSHSEIEVPLVPRTWYLGAAHDIASGAVPGVGRNLFFGAPEIWARGLWSSIVGLSSGAGFGVVLPLPLADVGDDLSVLETVRVVRPWDSAYFADRTLTLRPWFDIRHIAGRFIFQFRQGLDIAISVKSLKEGERRTEYIARSTFYLGFRAAKFLGLGLEFWEVYQLTADLPDDKRAAFTVSPSIRLLLGRVAPAFSVLVPLATPLRGEAASYFAARFNVAFDFDLGKRAKGGPRAAEAAPHAPPGS
jgi:hypothetical protein